MFDDASDMNVLDLPLTKLLSDNFNEGNKIDDFLDSSADFIDESSVEKFHDGFVKQLLDDFLKQKGYSSLKPRDKLGSGKTRSAFLLNYVSGAVKQDRVVKIPFNIDKNSICTVVNKSKEGDMDINEAVISNLLYHPNLIQVLENFQFGQYALGQKQGESLLLDNIILPNLTINVESYFRAQSLDNLVNTVGRIQDQDKIYNIFSQVIAGVKYANFFDTKNNEVNHSERGILLRDIKPSNILVNNDGEVKITDLQNAKKISEITELSLPTRGGTAYTRPELINSMVTGEKSKATRQTDMYSVAASLYFTLAGEDAFNYNIRELGVDARGGYEIDVNGEKKRVELRTGHYVVSEINLKEHENTLTEKLKNVPKKYRKLLKRGLTTNDKIAYRDIKDFEVDFDKTNKPLLGDFRTKLYNSLKPIGQAFVGAVAAFGFIYLLATAEPHEAGPTMAQILQKEDFTNFSMQTWNSPRDSIYAMDILKPSFKKVGSRLPAILSESYFDGMGTNFNFLDEVACFTETVHRIDGELQGSLLASILLNGYTQDDIDDVYKYESGPNAERLSPVYVPKNFVIKYNSYSGAQFSDALNASALAAMYLKGCIPRQERVVDVFVNYFCTNDEIAEARLRTGSLNYFPQEEDEGYISPGFSAVLNSSKVKLINDALAIYMISSMEDRDLKIDFDAIPELPGLYGQYKQIQQNIPNMQDLKVR